MNLIIKLVLNISISVIIYSIIVSVIENSKYIQYIKNILTLSVILLVFDFAFSFNFKNITTFDTEDYKINESVIWDNALQNVSDDLEKQMLNLCKNNGLIIDEIDVKLTTNYSDIEIESIKIAGIDKKSAKNLIAGHFNIGIAYINTDGEENEWYYKKIPEQ